MGERVGPLPHLVCGRALRGSGRGGRAEEAARTRRSRGAELLPLGSGGRVPAAPQTGGWRVPVGAWLGSCWLCPWAGQEGREPCPQRRRLWREPLASVVVTLFTRRDLQRAPEGSRGKALF